jgi:hypothetical protein
MSGDDKETWRMRLSHRLHMWATRVHSDFHTHEITTPQGDVIWFSCYWQWTGSWPIGAQHPGWSERCSCSAEDLQ